ncbi:hypothetical protein [Mycolicibacterium farcinogenes]|uniref:Uncharacterized protein n=2 Tax=Mycobacteriaceae TaxID=1762 RepID=A0ACD1FRC1_MYCFR|nr:hypothetical protein [Mycolicibacterium farcinogenes]QZH69540.1 hypothetical protein K6L26_31020 [Mycolicibacterium farcinogenes]
MSLDGLSVKDIAAVLGLGVRDVRRFTQIPLIPLAVVKGQPLDALAYVESAVDDVVRHVSGLDADELWDWARIWDSELGHRSHTQYAIGDNVEQALIDVKLFSRRLLDAGLDDYARAEVQRKLRLAQARARVFGAEDRTIITHTAT